MSKSADVFSSPINPLFSPGMGDRKETFISFQQFSRPAVASVTPPWSVVGGPGLVMENNPFTDHVKRKLTLNTPGNRDNISVPLYTKECGNEYSHMLPEKRKRHNANENADKPPPRKRKGNKGRYKEVPAFPTTKEQDVLPSGHLPYQRVLGVSGLDAKRFDLLRYMNEISSGQFMFDQPGLLLKQEVRMKNAVENISETGVRLGLQNMSRPLGGENSISMPKPIDSRPQKRMLDLNALDFESPLVDEIEETASLCTKKPFSSGSSIENRKPEDLPMAFCPIDSMDGLIQQLGGVPLGNNSSSYEVDPSHEAISRVIPARLFLFNSGKASQGDNPCDKIVKSVSEEESTGKYALKNTLLQNCIGSMLPSVLDCDVTEPKHVDKLGMRRAQWFDIDLNKQCKEATEGFDAMVTTGLMLPEPLTLMPIEPILGEKNSSMTIESSIDLTSNERQQIHSAPMDASLSSVIGIETVANLVVNSANLEDEEVLRPSYKTADIMTKKDVVNNQDPKSDSLSTNMVEITIAKKDVENKPEGFHLQGDAECIRESFLICDSQIEKNIAASFKKEAKSSILERVKKKASEVVEDDVPSTGFPKLGPRVQSPMLSLPCSLESDEIGDGVLYSPGMQATAHLLCKMAMSSSLFYVDNGNEASDDHLIQQPSDSPSTVGAFGMSSIKAIKEKKIRKDDQSCKIHLKGHQSRKSKGRIVVTSSNASSSMIMNEKRNDLVVSYEPKFKYKVEIGKGNKINLDRHSIAGSSKLLTDPSMKEELKGNDRIECISKIVLSPPSKASSFLQGKTDRVETKPSADRRGHGKVFRPRSNSTKGCLS